MTIQHIITTMIWRMKDV